jgi:hypothetical protein
LLYVDPARRFNETITEVSALKNKGRYGMKAHRSQPLKTKGDMV